MMPDLRIDVKANIAFLENAPNEIKEGLTECAYRGALVGASLAKEGIRLGRPEWPQLKPATIERKGHARILFDKGRLYASIGASKGQSIGTASYGTDVQYAACHEFGEGVPRRSFLAPTTKGKELDDIVSAVRSEFKKIFD